MTFLKKKLVKFLIRLLLIFFLLVKWKKGKRVIHVFKRRLFQCLEANYLLLIIIFLISKIKRRNNKSLHFLNIHICIP